MWRDNWAPGSSLARAALALDSPDGNLTGPGLTVKGQGALPGAGGEKVVVGAVLILGKVVAGSVAGRRFS